MLSSRAMKVLVTGGSGFIGTHLCRQLRKEGHEVHVLDLVAPKTAVDGVHYQKGDVRIAKDIERMVDGVDAVYHFAALVSVPYCQEHPVESFDTNLLATSRVLDAVRRESGKRGKKVKLIFAGSSVVYGDLGKRSIPLSEKGPTAAQPLSFYGAQKLGSEHAISLYHEHYGIPAVVFRFFNVYGPGQDPKSPYSGVISIFAQAIKDGNPLRLNGGGEQTRDFVSVHDLARANVLALKLDPSRCDGRAINLGTGQMTTIKELAQEMMKAGNKEVEAQNAPARQGDVLHSLADISRAKEALGWTPQVTLNDGLSELIRGL